MRGLPIFDRLALALKALTSQFDAGRSSLARQMLGGIFPASTGPAPTRSGFQLLQTMNESPWVRACAGRVADAKAAIMWRAYIIKSKTGKPAPARDVEYLQKAPIEHRFRLYKDIQQAGELVEITDHILLTSLRRGSSALSGWDTRWLQSVYLDLVGECFLLKQRNQLGAPEAFWIIPPHWVAETPTPKRKGYRLQWKAFQADVPEKEMLWLKQPNAMEPYERGAGIAKSLDDDLATDEFASKHLLKFFKNSARPDLLIMPKEGSFDQVEVDRFEEWWNNKLQGFWKSFRPLFLRTPVDVKLIEQNFRNLQMTEIRQHERDTVMQVWGIPPEMFGVLQSSNRSTIDQAPYIFNKYCIVPRVERERDFYQERLVPEYDDRIILDYVSPVPQDKEFKLKVMTTQPECFQKNEFRELAEYDPLEELGEDLAVGASALQQAQLDADAEAAEAEENNPSKPQPRLVDLDDEEAAALYLINRKLMKR